MDVLDGGLVGLPSLWIVNRAVQRKLVNFYSFKFLDIKGSKAGLTSVAVINLNHCRDHTIEQEPKDETLDPLYPVDINKVRISIHDFQQENNPFIK